MARFALSQRLNAVVNGSIIQVAASATAFVPDPLWASIETTLTSSGITVLTSDYDEAAVIVTNSTTQSINDSTDTLVTWNTEPTNGDIRAFHSTSSLTGRLTVPAGYDGLYMGFAYIQFPANSVGRRQVTVYVDGTATALGGLTALNAVNSLHVCVPFGGVLTAGQYVECKAYQSSTAAMNITPERFFMSRVQRI